MTTGKGEEGTKGQHVVSTRSSDKGKTWTPLTDIEPAKGPEASWAVPLLTPTGRVYAFYDYNGDRIDMLGQKRIRADMLGWYVYKFSDDGGKTWSKDRYRLPMRPTLADRNNDWKGKVQIFWGICKPQVAQQNVLFSFTKIGKYMLDQGEGFLYRSDNILTEKDPAKLSWDLWPEEDNGIRSPREGSVQEEHNIVWLGGPHWYCVYRTTQGYPLHTYSHDGGKTWDIPTPMTYSPGGRIVRNPRACPRLFRTKEGKFLFWFHNHAGKSFQDRNPAWISGGILKDGKLHGSQPEILLYDANLKTGMSYPDLIEDDGRFWITETIKFMARLHEIMGGFLTKLWNQGQSRDVARVGKLLDLGPDELKSGQAKIPEKLDLRRGGVSLDFWVRFDKLDSTQILLDTRAPKKETGLVVQLVDRKLRVDLNDGKTKASWDSDADLFTEQKTHHIMITLDAGPRLILFVVDGNLCDGGGKRQFGWGRFPAGLGDVTGSGQLQLAPSLHRLRLFGRALMTSEAVSHYHAGP